MPTSAAARSARRRCPAAGVRGYARDDVERLKQRSEERRTPDKAAARSLQWGLPVLESSIALIDGQRLFYRGHDAVGLARSRSLQEVASLIWTGRFDGLTAAAATHVPAGAGGIDPSAPFVCRAQALLAAAAAADPAAFDIRPEAVRSTGWRIMAALVHSATGRPWRDQAIEAALAQAWRVGSGGADLIRAMLVLCADHELNVSSFTARCVASAGSSPYAVVSAGLSALEGPRHGGSSVRAEAMLTACRPERSLRAALAARLARGNRLDGFGHPLYPDGDPRATAILARLRSARAGFARTGLRPERCPRRDRRHRRAAQPRLRAGRGGSGAAAPAGRAAHAVCHRPHHRLDWARARAVRHWPADSAAGEVRGSGAVPSAVDVGELAAPPWGRSVKSRPTLHLRSSSALSSAPPNRKPL